MSELLSEQWSQMIASSVDFHCLMAKECVREATERYSSPSAMFHPKLYIDGSQWCALYGEDLQSGVTGFGKSPAQAMWNFDENWNKELPCEG